MPAAEQIPSDRRQRRWHELHDRIYASACELFLESDFVSTSVDQIAERADVARKTAFNHFPRKRDFITEWGNRRRQHAMEALPPELASQPAVVSLRHHLATLATLSVGDRPLTIRMLMGWREAGGPFDADPHALIEIFRESFATAIDQGQVSRTVDPARMSTILYSSYFGLLYDWCGGTDDAPPFDLHAEFTTLLDILLRGTRPA